MIKGIYHVAYTVSDLDRSLEFYRDALGCTEYFRLDRDDGSLMLLYLEVGENGYIELFPGGEGPAKQPPAGRAGYRHLCLEVDAMDATLADLREHGITVDKGPLTGRDGNVQAWISDPDGNPIELMQRINR